MKVKAFVLLCIALLVPGSSRAETYNIQRYCVTGFYRILSQPAFVFTEVAPFPAGIGFNIVAEFNPNGQDPIPLIPKAPGSAVLASIQDPFLIHQTFRQQTHPLSTLNCGT